MMFDFLDKNKDEKVEMIEFMQIENANIQTTAEPQSVTQSLVEMAIKIN